MTKVLLLKIRKKVHAFFLKPHESNFEINNWKPKMRAEKLAAIKKGIYFLFYRYFPSNLNLKSKSIFVDSQQF